MRAKKDEEIDVASSVNVRYDMVPSAYVLSCNGQEKKCAFIDLVNFQMIRQFPTNFPPYIFIGNVMRS